MTKSRGGAACGDADAAAGGREWAPIDGGFDAPYRRLEGCDADSAEGDDDDDDDDDRLDLWRFRMDGAFASDDGRGDWEDPGGGGGSWSASLPGGMGLPDASGSFTLVCDTARRVSYVPGGARIGGRGASSCSSESDAAVATVVAVVVATPRGAAGPPRAYQRARVRCR